jgi:hypothetical protein
MAAILGLVGTEDYASNRYKNPRRKVFYDYPNGSFPLTGIMSLMDEESGDDPEFSWFEKRMATQRTLTTSQGSSKGPFTTSADSDAGDNLTLTAGTVYIMYVASSEQFRVGHIFRVPLLYTSSTGTKILRGRVTENPETTDGTNFYKIKFTPLETITAIDNGTTNENVGAEVLIIGSAYAQGAAGSSEAAWNLPIELSNYCQIFRTEFSLTGTAMKTSARFDDTGVYADKAKEASIYHMIELEKAFLYGTKTKTVDATSNLPTYTSGGILWHLEQWEKAASTYRGAGSSAITADTDDDKRIIENTSGVMTVKLFNDLLERAFRVTNNRANEKLALCGGGFLNVINQMYMASGCLDVKLPMTDTFGMNVVGHQTPFGTVYYKTHPLFTQNPALRSCCLILDVQNLKYKYVAGRDTELLSDRQPNNADYVTDEWLTECGLELRFPESHMFIKNVTSFIPT